MRVAKVLAKCYDDFIKFYNLQPILFTKDRTMVYCLLFDCLKYSIKLHWMGWENYQTIKCYATYNHYVYARHIQEVKILQIDFF